MDYALVTGSDGHSDRLRWLYTNRRADIFSAGEVSHAVHRMQVQGIPVDRFFIASHANDRGWLSIDIGAEPGEEKQTTVEEVVRAIKSGWGRIGEGVFAPTGFVHVRGCEIGVDQQFMKLFKRALGDKVPVTAPRWFHGVHREEGNGVYEFFGHRHTVTSLNAFTSAKELIEAFKKAGLKFAHGGAVPNEFWARWIPGKLKASQELMRSTTVPLGSSVGGNTQLDLPVRFATWPEATDTFSFKGGSVPKNDAARVAFLETNLPKLSELKADYPFANLRYPVHEQFGFATVKHFVAGMRWRVVAADGGVEAQGSRQVYKLTSPITKANGELRFNFYPDDTTQPSHAPIGDTEPAFFAQV